MTCSEQELNVGDAPASVRLHKISIANILPETDDPSLADPTLRSVNLQPCQAVQITLKPNGSGNRQALFVCASILSFSIFLIGIISAVFGAWMVLPFAGLEILVLAVGTLAVRAHADDVDVLTISKNHVHLTTRRPSGIKVKTIARQWTQIRVEPGPTRHAQSRLLVGAHGQYVEIGQFLVDHMKHRQCQLLENLIRNEI